MEQKIYEALCEAAGKERVFCQEPMSRHTTFRTGGPAQWLVTPTFEAVGKIQNLCREYEIPCLVIGNGSNLLAGDKGIPGVVVEIGKAMAEITVDGTRVRAQAGALLSAVAAKAAAAGLTGLEFASGIPGSMGGAVFMNAGAYGGEIKDVLVSATVLTPEGEILTIPVQELDLSYRHSVISERNYIVLAAEMELAEGDPKAIQARMSELKELRNSKQPVEFPSAGSTFKRPEGYFAGKLIQDAGLKGFTVGGAQVSEKHSGFVINIGNATSADVRSLMEQVQQRVNTQFGVMLEPEVRFVGEF